LGKTIWTKNHMKTIDNLRGRCKCVGCNEYLNLKLDR
jgi:hypothetical protein